MLAEEAEQAPLWGVMELSEPGGPAWVCLDCFWPDCVCREQGEEEMMPRDLVMGFAGPLPTFQGNLVCVVGARGPRCSEPWQSSRPSIGANACAGRWGG